MNRQLDSSSQQVASPTVDQSPEKSRRRFMVGAALAAAPLIVTLTARPAEARQSSLGAYGSAV